MKKMQWLLAVSVIALLAGCNQAGDRQMGTEVGEGVGQVRQEAVGPGGGQAQMGREEITSRLENMPAGQPVSEYTRTFEEMGLQVTDVNMMGDRVEYDLRRADERYLVILDLQDIGAEEQRDGMEPDMASRQVQDVNVSEMSIGRIDERQSDQQVMGVVNKVRALKPGKQPVEYLPAINQIGRVTEFDLNGNTAEVEFEAADGNQFSVNMEVDENSNKVTAIEVDRSYWQM